MPPYQHNTQLSLFYSSIIQAKWVEQFCQIKNNPGVFCGCGSVKTAKGILEGL